MTYPAKWDDLRTRGSLGERVKRDGEAFTREVVCTVCGWSVETRINEPGERRAVRVEAIEHVRFQHPAHFERGAT